MDDFASPLTPTSVDAATVGATSPIQDLTVQTSQRVDDTAPGPVTGQYDSMLDRARDLLRGAAYKTRPV